MTNKRLPPNWIRVVIAGIVLVTAGLALYYGAKQVQIAEKSKPDSIPTISGLSRSSGPVGARITLRGSGFTPTDNVIQFGVFYVPELYDSRGESLTFRVPGTTYSCSPKTPKGPCTLGMQSISAGKYDIIATNENGESNSVTFTVTE